VALFVTLDQVKARLRITSTADDADVQSMADQAEAKILGWCSTTTRTKAIAEAWDETTVPQVVVAAILVQAGEFYRFRGDDLEGPARQDPEELHVLVRELLRAYHDPGIA
jgi:hypothetical protein